MIGKALLGSPWAWLVIALALAGAGGGLYYQGRTDGSAACEARWLKRDADRIQAETNAAAERDAKIELSQDENARLAAERLAQVYANQDKADHYDAVQASRASDDCDITDDDARSLSDIK